MEKGDWTQEFRRSRNRRIVLSLLSAVAGGYWLNSIAFGVFLYLLIVVVEDWFLIVGESIRLWAGQQARQ